jgi:hypothetical protein
MLLEAGIVELSEAGDLLSFAPDWRMRLAEIDDLEADRLRRWAWHDRDRCDYRKVLRKRARPKHRAARPTTPARPSEFAQPANVVADGYISDLALVEAEPGRDPAPTSDLAETVREYLERNPRTVSEHGLSVLPGWLAGTLWAHDLVEGKPEASDMRAAISELGGAGYLTTVSRLVGAA